MSQQKFETFYYSKVALGEGCGCAERVIDLHEFNRLAGRSAPRLPLFRLPKRGSFKRFLRIAGLTSRPRRP